METLQVTHGQIGGYGMFFLGTALAGLPALLLCLWLSRQMRAQRTAQLADAGPTG